MIIVFKRRDKLEEIKQREQRQEEDLERLQRRSREIQREVELYKLEREANSS